MGYSKPHDGAFWTERFGPPSGVEHWHLYAYEYLDDLHFMPAARETLRDWEHADETLKAIGERFREMGWEGDGELQILWLPPFAGAGPQDTFGCYAIHVKQVEDGISWIASPYLLPFDRLFQPSDAQYAPPGESKWKQGDVR